MTPPSNKTHVTNIRVKHRATNQTSSSAAAKASSSRSPLTLLLIALALLTTIVFLTVHPVIDPDSWFHLALGRWILEHGAFPRTDPFSYTAGNTPYVPSGWLTAVLMTLADRLYPESSLGPILLVTLSVFVAAALVMWRGVMVRRTVPTALVLLAGLQLGVSRFSPRPDAWSIPCLVALFFLLSHSWSSNSQAESQSDVNARATAPKAATLWLLPALIVVWANLHAGVLLAIPVLLSYLAWLLMGWYRDRNRKWLVAGIPVALGCIAWIANPYGTGLVGLARRIENMPRVHWVMEWMSFFSPGFPLTWPTYISAAVLLAVAAWVLVRSWRKFHPLEILWVLGLFLLMVTQRRQVALAGIALPLLLARHLPPVSSAITGKTWLRAAPSIAAAAVICAIQVVGANGNGGGWPRYGRNCSVLPCYAADFLNANSPPQHIFNSYNLGGYLLNILSPETPVYIDGRLDTYPPEVWLDMLALEENRLSVDDFVSRYKVKTFVITVSQSFSDPQHLASRLASRSDYALVYFDDLAAVFVHRENATAEYVQKLGFETLSPWDLKRMTAAMAKPGGIEKAAKEMDRQLHTVPASAAVHALAGYIAWAAGDARAASSQLAAAEAINPSNGLLTIVNNRLKLAERVQRR